MRSNKILTGKFPCCEAMSRLVNCPNSGTSAIKLALGEGTRGLPSIAILT